MTIISNSCISCSLSRSLTDEFKDFQGLSRTCAIKFKDFQAPVLFSSIFKALNLGEKFTYFQGLSRMRGNPAVFIVETCDMQLTRFSFVWQEDRVLHCRAVLTDTVTSDMLMHSLAEKLRLGSAFWSVTWFVSIADCETFWSSVLQRLRQREAI